MPALMAPHLAAASTAKLIRVAVSIAKPMSKVPSSNSSSGTQHDQEFHCNGTAAIAYETLEAADAGVTKDRYEPISALRRGHQPSRMTANAPSMSGAVVWTICACRQPRVNRS
jgi:hypothetical protein